MTEGEKPKNRWQRKPRVDGLTEGQADDRLRRAGTGQMRVMRRPALVSGVLSKAILADREKRPVDDMPMLMEERGVKGARTKEQREADQAVVARMYCQAYAISEIATKIGIHPSTVIKDLEAIRDRWRTITIIDWVQGKNRELEKIDALEHEYWQGYRRSQQPKVRQRTQEQHGQQAVVTVVHGTETMIGDPRWLEGVQWCIHERTEILGLKSIAAATDAARIAGEHQHDPITDETRLRLMVGEFVTTRRSGGAGASRGADSGDRSVERPDDGGAEIISGTAIERGSHPS